MSGTGSSFAAPYVSGILAIFYGAEGKDLNPELARTRLLAQASDWMTLPTDDDIDWHDSPLAFANTGNRKGNALSPPLKYVDGPKADASATSDDSPTFDPDATATPCASDDTTCVTAGSGTSASS